MDGLAHFPPTDLSLQRNRAEFLWGTVTNDCADAVRETAQTFMARATDAPNNALLLVILVLVRRNGQMI